MEPDIIYSWERLPEYVATQQYSRCLGRILRSLPWWVRRRAVRPMTGAAVLIAQGIAGLNADVPPSETLSAREREEFRARALVGIRASREGLEALADVRRASRPDLLAARELLERIEAGVRDAEVPPDWL
jgi:hypothetical protein